MIRRANVRSSIRAFRAASELRAVISKIRRRVLEKVSTSDLTPSQTAVVLRLEMDQPATTSGLARAEGITPQSMARIVEALAAMEFIVSATDPADRRQTLLSLSDVARRWLSEGRAARQDWLSGTIEARLSAEEQEHLIVAIALLNRIADD
jgi:DNA-binding MarR family transcriptional regulator